MKKNKPNYEALDKHGMPFIREARSIGELPKDQVADALAEATESISKHLGVESVGLIKYGTPVFLAMRGMNRNIAKRHEHAKILLSNGCDVSLDFCPSYETSGECELVG